MGTGEMAQRTKLWSQVRGPKFRSPRPHNADAAVQSLNLKKWLLGSRRHLWGGTRRSSLFSRSCGQETVPKTTWKGRTHPQVVLWPLQMYCGIGVPTMRHTDITHLHNQRKKPLLWMWQALLLALRTQRQQRLASPPSPSPRPRAADLQALAGLDEWAGPPFWCWLWTALV